jgi:serine/threonine protein kinase
VAKALLDARADPNVADCWGNTPLQNSQNARSLNLEELLREAGAQDSNIARLHSLRTSASMELWLIDRSEVTITNELCTTLKSVMHRARWRNTDVVTKQALQGVEMSDQEIEKEMLNELRLLASLRHPDLVMFLGACLETPLMFISAFMPGGDLECYYAAKRRATQSIWTPGMRQMKNWMSAVARALCFLHSCAQPIVHRDLKPLNLLLTENAEELKITDFGISRMMEALQELSTLSPGFEKRRRMTGGVGSCGYMAPEVARHEKYNEKADIFSFALIMYFISSGRDPYHEIGTDYMKILKQYSEGKEPRPTITDCPSVIRAIMKDAWHSKPSERPSASDLVEQLAELPTATPACCSLM